MESELTDPLEIAIKNDDVQTIYRLLEENSLMDGVYVEKHIAYQMKHPDLPRVK